MRKQSFSGKRIKVVHGTFPLALAKVDDAVVVTQTEDDFGDPVVDMDGDGAHVEGVDKSGTVVIKVDPSSTPTIQYLEAIRQAGQAAPVLSGRDLATNNKAFSVSDVVLKKYPSWQGGVRPQVLEYTFAYIKGEYLQDGPRILPV